MKLTKQYNQGLGFQAVSLFVELEEQYPIEMVDFWYKTIDDRQIYDVILTGKILENIPFLDWITGRFALEDVKISAMLDMKSVFDFRQANNKMNIYLQRTVLVINSIFPHWTAVLEWFDNPEDIFLYNLNSINELNAIYKGLARAESKGKLFFNSNKLDPKIVLEDGFLNAYPYDGDL